MKLFVGLVASFASFALAVEVRGVLSLDHQHWDVPAGYMMKVLEALQDAVNRQVARTTLKTGELHVLQGLHPNRIRRADCTYQHAFSDTGEIPPSIDWGTEWNESTSGYRFWGNFLGPKRFDEFGDIPKMQVYASPFYPDWESDRGNCLNVPPIPFKEIGEAVAKHSTLQALVLFSGEPFGNSTAAHSAIDEFLATVTREAGRPDNTWHGTLDVELEEPVIYNALTPWFDQFTTTTTSKVTTEQTEPTAGTKPAASAPNLPAVIGAAAAGSVSLLCLAATAWHLRNRRRERQALLGISERQDDVPIVSNETANVPRESIVALENA